MGHNILFGSMTPEARRFYSRVLNTVILNGYAVRHGLFPILLCETDDPRVAIMWKDAVPSVIDHIEKRRAKGLGAE